MSKQGLAVLAILGLFGFAGWVLIRSHRPKPPRVVDLVAFQNGELPHAFEPGGSLKKTEAVDFHVEVFRPSYIYVFRVVAEQAQLEWGPTEDLPFEPGVWGANWEEGDKGMRFLPGKAQVYVVTSPGRFDTAMWWDAATVRDPTKKCRECLVTSFDVTVMN